MNFEKEKNIIPFSCFSSHPIKKKNKKKNYFPKYII